MDTEYRQIPESTTGASSLPSSSEDGKQQRKIVIGLVVVVVVILAILITGLVFLLSPNTTAVTVARVRDIFIIVMALESLFVGLILIVLMIQLARLINLLQNEVRPILDSTNETVSNLRGTTEFISENLVQPIIKLNEYLAGMQKITEILSFKRKR
jgi:hypothetical protein